MLEIIILIYLTREIGRLATRKGLKSTAWKIYLILGWCSLELIGSLLGLMIFGMHNLISVMLVGWAFAVTSYFLIKARLHSLPDSFEEEVNKIGSN